MCLYPKLINNRKYIANKKNGGNIPPVSDERVLMVPVGCGKCIECRKQKKREWQVRMLEEIRQDNTGKFVTLTFSEENLIKLEEEEGNTANNYIRYNQVATIAVRRFLGRWRKKFGKSVKHWLVTELGHKGTERIHLHGIIFTTEEDEIIKERWGYGNVWIGSYVNEKTVNYIIKYISKIDGEHPEYKSKILCTSGIGKGYMDRYDSSRNRYKGEETREYYITRSGHRLNLPIYYRNKIYDEDERERLWLNKLDKEERWVMGEKIDVSKNDDEYNQAVEYYRCVNKRLGYGDDSVNWDEKMYKNNKKRLELRTKYLKEVNKMKKDLDIPKSNSKLETLDLPNIDFNNLTTFTNGNKDQI